MAMETPQTRYEAKYCRKVAYKFNVKYDADILEQLDKQPNKQGYLKALIRADIEREKREKEET